MKKNHYGNRQINLNTTEELLYLGVQAAEIVRFQRFRNSKISIRLKLCSLNTSH